MKKFLLGLFAFMSASVVFAEDAPATPSKQGSYMQTIVMIAVFLLIFYFVLWRPEQKRKKRLEIQRSSIKMGDKVTAMGIIGTVAEVKDKTVIIKMIDGSKIEFLKAAVTEVQSPSEETEKAKA